MYIQEGETELNSDAWSPGETAPILPDHPASNWTEAAITNRKPHGGWEDTEFEPWKKLLDLTQIRGSEKKREERKLMRQKEMEARRAGKNTAGPMKLGAKKV